MLLTQLNKVISTFVPIDSGAVSNSDPDLGSDQSNVLLHKLPSRNPLY